MPITRSRQPGQSPAKQKPAAHPQQHLQPLTSMDPMLQEPYFEEKTTEVSAARNELDDFEARLATGGVIHSPPPRRVSSRNMAGRLSASRSRGGVVAPHASAPMRQLAASNNNTSGATPLVNGPPLRHLLLQSEEDYAKMEQKKEGESERAAVHDLPDIGSEDSD